PPVREAIHLEALFPTIGEFSLEAITSGLENFGAGAPVRRCFGSAAGNVLAVLGSAALAIEEFAAATTGFARMADSFEVIDSRFSSSACFSLFSKSPELPWSARRSLFSSSPELAED